jgi:transcriptional regulator of acetoin/glycerol metabolism
MYTVGAVKDEDQSAERMGRMGTLARYPQRVAKQKYTPPNDEVAARIDAAVELYERKQTIDAEYREALAKLADKQGDDVPIQHLAERLGVERKTVYRHLGRTMK